MPEGTAIPHNVRMNIPREKTLIRDTILTTFWSGLGKASGLLVTFFIAAWFGSTLVTDAFFFTFAWISCFSVVFSMAIESVIVPFISHLRSDGESVGGFVSRLVIRGNLGLLLITAGFFLLLSLLFPYITSFPASDLGLVRALLFEIAPLVILIVNSSVLVGLLNAYHRFALPAVSPAFRSLVAVLFILVARNRLGIHSVPIGYILGEMARLFFLLVGVRKLDIEFDRRSACRLGEFFSVAGRQMMGMIAISLIPTADKTMASWLVAGSISNLFYAERFYQIPVILLSGGLLVTLLSHWSGRVYSAAGGESIRRSLHRTLRVVAAISVTLVIILTLFRERIVRLALGWGAFDEANLGAVSLLFLILLFSLVPELLSIVLTRVCIIFKQTEIIRNLGILRLILKIVLNLVLMRIWGIYGIAAATVLTIIISLFYLWNRTLKIESL